MWREAVVIREARVSILKPQKLSALVSRHQPQLGQDFLDRQQQRLHGINANRAKCFRSNPAIDLAVASPLIVRITRDRFGFSQTNSNELGRAVTVTEHDLALGDRALKDRGFDDEP